VAKQTCSKTPPLEIDYWLDTPFPLAQAFADPPLCRLGWVVCASHTYFRDFKVAQNETSPVSVPVRYTAR
jgi:hypothetical protein